MLREVLVGAPKAGVCASNRVLELYEHEHRSLLLFAVRYDGHVVPLGHAAGSIEAVFDACRTLFASMHH